MDETLQITSAAVTDKGLSDKRPQNEDSFLEMPQRGLYVVADGVGGAHGGEVASQMAVEILGEAFANKPYGADAEDVLRTAIERANTAIYQMAGELPKLGNMATTIVAIHISGDIATIGHVGDSRLYRVDPQGAIHRETEDHSVVADEVRAGRLTEEQAETHPSRNVINRALGAEPLVQIDLKTILVQPGTGFLLCSDGITRHISDDEINSELTSGAEPAEVCEKLKRLCYERGAEDNLTALVINVGFAVENAPDIHEEETIASARVQPQQNETADNARSEPIVYRSEEARSSFAGRLITSVGLLILGSLIGLAAHHFLLLPPHTEATPPVLSEMKSENIAMTSFEKLRRTVDSDPAAYLKEVPPPRDAEDFYLLGRAQLLTGDVANARLSFLEAQKQLASADATNTGVLATDVAIAIAIVADAEALKRFNSEIEKTTNRPTSANVNR